MVWPAVPAKITSCWRVILKEQTGNAYFLIDVIVSYLREQIGLITTVILGLIGIYVTLRYSPNFIVTGKGKARERYKIVESFEFREKSETFDLYRLVLDKSSFKNATGFADLMMRNGGLEMKHYAFINSCIHNVIAPGKVLIRNSDSWVERAPSNKFLSYKIETRVIEDSPEELIPEKYRKYREKCLCTESDFEYPKTYTGPRYKKRVITFCRGIGIIRAETTYKGGGMDLYLLRKHKVQRNPESLFPLSIGNYWIYDIKYSVGANKININE
jgi:hypothetical protein